MASTVNLDKSVKLYDKQQAFKKSNVLFRAFAAGVGSGKSWIGAYDMICRAKPGRLYMVVAPTYTLMSDASFRSMEKMVIDLDLAYPGDIKRGRPPSIKLKTGAEVLFRSGDEPDMLRGPNLSGVWMDEASLMKQDVFDVLIGRLREGGELGWLSATFTPKGKTHWTYKKFANLNDSDVEMFHASTDESPFLPENFFESRRRQYTSKQSDQELRGQFLDDGGNHFCPRAWPRYWHNAQNAYSTKLHNRGRQVHLKDECVTIIGFDLALNKPNRKKLKEVTEDKTDFCAFVVADLTRDGNLLILDCVNERIRLEGKGPALSQLCRRWRPDIVATDDDMIAESMRLEFRRYRDIPEVKIIPIGSKNKVERATAAIIRGENGLIYLPEKSSTGKDEEWLEVFVDCLSTFNGVDDEFDDVPDAMGIVGRIADQLKGDGREHPLPEVLIGAPDVFGMGGLGGRVDSYRDDGDGFF